MLQRIRLEIIEGIHRPGSRLVEQSLADQFGVSRGPVREALLQLELEGVVQILPRRGALVMDLTPVEASEIYLLRGHLEVLAVRLARHHWTAGHNARLRDLMAAMGRLKSSDWMEAMQLDQDFHRTIVDASKNKTLIQMYQTMDAKVFACFLAVKRQLGRGPMDMAERHRTFTESLLNGDFTKAEIRAMEHWEATSRRFRDLVAGN